MAFKCFSCCPIRNAQMRILKTDCPYKINENWCLNGLITSCCWQTINDGIINFYFNHTHFLPFSSWIGNFFSYGRQSEHALRVEKLFEYKKYARRQLKNSFSCWKRNKIINCFRESFNTWNNVLKWVEKEEEEGKIDNFKGYLFAVWGMSVRHLTTLWLLVMVLALKDRKHFL